MAESRRSCASCGAPNEEDARFCEGCGTSLARICATCGVEASATARFCRGCGAPLDSRAAPTRDAPFAGPVRKTVTVMFADLAGSTTFEERVDAETAREVIGRYHDLLRDIADRYRAGVTKYIGDGFMAVWGVPEIGADDAVHAVDAAVELQERFVGFAAQIADTHGVELALRVSVNTGEVVVGDGDADLVGDALNVGARLEAECPRGRVVVGEETWRATRGRYGYESLGEVQVKGRNAPVSVYQWLGRQSESADAAPFVGRADEVRRLQTAMDDAVSARTARLVTVIGDPGVGKSRLAAEFTKAHVDARVVEARCVLEGTVALGPLVEALRASDLENDLPAGIPERDRLLRDLEGLASGVPGSVEENFWALRRYVEVLATDKPVALVLDDIQWADTLLLDFIEHLVEWVKDVPVLVLALARPELRDIRPELISASRWASEAVHLGGLDAGATAELAAKVLGATRLPDELLSRLPSSTGGNPLFVRELIGMLAHDGVLVEEPHGWRLTIDVDAITIPPTIHALLASRLERLDAPDRRVLEVASVVGSDFSLGMVQALTDKGADAIKLSLKRLRRLELAQPSGAYLGDEPVWRFHHVLIRDVAYRRLLKSDRANLHERLADWVETGGQSVAFEADEMIARHLEAAYTYRVELRTLDEHTGDLALRSARHYATSARRALDRDELVSAGTQAARGAAVATADEALHAELLLIGCEAYLSAGDVAAGAPLVDDLDRIADESLAPWATCYRCQFVIYTEPERLPEVDARLQGAIDEFSRRRDPAGLAKAHRVRASARSRLGRIGDCEADLFEALIAARQSGDHRQITAALGAAPGAALWGPSPVPKAGGRCLDVVRMQRMTTAAPSLEATSLRHLAVLELLRGRPDKARKMLGDARQVVADLGLRHGLMETELFAGHIEAMEGDAAAAEPHFRTALDGFKALGVGADAGQAAALLARMILAQGRLDEADRYAAESERLAGRNLKTAIAWRAVRAEILAAQGRHEEATTLARDAVAVAAGTDLVLDHAEACLALCRVLDVAGDTKGANIARSNAEALYTAKEVSARIGRVEAPSAPAPTTPISTEPVASRMTVTNRAAEAGRRLGAALRERNVEAAADKYAERLDYDDHRRWSGGPIRDRGGARVAIERILAQYRHFDEEILAVRGERLALATVRKSDDAGNVATDLIVFEVDDDDRVVYQGRFDEDFEAAYRELDCRYYAGEGGAYSDSGLTLTDYVIALNRGDLERTYGDLSDPDMRVENRSHSVFVVPSVGTTEARANMEALHAMVTSLQSWHSVLDWVSSTCCVARYEREAVGPDSEHYAWTGLAAIEVRDLHIVSMCLFELDDEDAAFSYAEERVRATTSRLSISNRASATSDALGAASNASDIDAAVACYADSFVFDDRRRISGDPIHGIAELRAATERLFTDYKHFSGRTLAVRGERLCLNSSRNSDEDGNASAYLHVREIGDDGRFVYDGRFDEDNFEDAYRELEHRYYAGEGAVFTAAGGVVTDCISAVNQSDFDRLFSELSTPDLRFEQHSRATLPNRSAADLRASFDTFTEMVASSQSWLAAVSWVSPEWLVSRFDRTAIGLSDEQFAWTRILVIGVRDGRLGTLCQFEFEDETAAFAYTQERARESASRLVVKNLASDTFDVVCRGMRNHDADAAVRVYSETYEYDDHRRLSGGPVRGVKAMRAGIALVCEQYPRLEWRTLAVRGELLELRWACQSDDAGNESAGLMVIEVDHDGRIIYQGRFDDDGFESAYRELDRRYYAGEGAQFASGGATLTSYVIALNRGDFGQAFEDLATPDAYIENRSRSVFGDRSTAEFRESIEELSAMVSSARTWHSAVRWLSPAWVVVRAEREAVGPEGEQYTWNRTYVIEIRDGRAASMCEFESADEEAAFAYAEERMRATTSRLTVSNRASTTWEALGRALNAADADGAMAAFSDALEYDDRRRLSGNPVADISVYRAAVELLVTQYDRVEWSILAVRGDRLALVSTHLSSDAGFEAAYLHLVEVNADGLVEYEGRFDEEDFEGAYRELEHRYYTGEGAVFAGPGAAATEWTLALNRREYDLLFNELTASDFRIENRSRSAFPHRSATEYRTTLEELDAMVASSRGWISNICWLSQNWSITRCQRVAVGEDGEQYTWRFLIAFEFRNGRVTSMVEFELDDEDVAFTYAEDQVRSHTSRLRISNRASEIAQGASQALQEHDVDALRVDPSEHFVYDDRRRITGAPIEGAADLHAATKRILQSYPHTEWRTIAVRGERLEMHLSRLWDDDGNEATTLNVMEFDDAGRLAYFGRFEEDDFDGASRELDQRYYAGEGAPFAENGVPASEATRCMDQNDFDRLFGELSSPDLVVKSRSSRAFPDRSAGEIRLGFEELNTLVASKRTWTSAIVWPSPACSVQRLDREAIGPDGEKYEWAMLLVSDHRDGLVTAICEFDPDDEEGAFAYAEEKVREQTGRLVVSNQASWAINGFLDMMRANDAAGAIAYYSEQFVYDDHRRLSGDPVVGREAMREGIARHIAQYSQYKFRTLAVRGQRLQLISSVASDADGNTTNGLTVFEADAGLITYHAPFDEDDFESAYRELERRYYSVEGAAFAEAGNTSTELVVLSNQGDLDRAFSELISPAIHVENRSRAGFPDRPVEEFRASSDELMSMFASVRIWNSAVFWLSPTCGVAKLEREAVGHDGERYSWTLVVVSEIVDGLLTSMCEFDLRDEKAAFDYAEERARAHSSQLVVTNRAWEIVDDYCIAMQSQDVDRSIHHYANTFEYDDRRHIGGTPIVGRDAMRLELTRLLAQYTQIEVRVLAVRGQCLTLFWNSMSDADGNTSNSLHVVEIEAGLIDYHGRFDEDDFDSAYRELERRYYLGEGAAFAEAGTLTTEYAIAANQGNFDRVFGDLSTPDLRLENRSRSGFPDRSVAEFRASMDELNGMIGAAVRSWNSAISWLSPNWSVARLEREAVGAGGEHYSWTRIVAVEVTDGRVATMCAFEPENEESAFAFAQERLLRTASRLAVTNPSVQSAERLGNALNAHDIDEIMKCFSDELVYDDRRRLTGDPIKGRAEFRAAFERILAQYSHFERRILAVRGERLNLHWGRWSDDSGNETTYLHVYEMDDDGLQIYEGRFDEDDFESAYRELEQRYVAGEGAAFADSVTLSARWLTALNRGEFDRMLSEFSTPDFQVESRSRSAFPARSAADLSASLHELGTMVSSLRTWDSAVAWLSPNHNVVRMEREGVGLDGEKYEWTRLYTTEIRNGLLASLCEFEVDDEAAAFAYINAKMSASSSRLAVTNRASMATHQIFSAMRAHDVDGVMKWCSNQTVYDDRRRLSGDPLLDNDALRAALTRIFNQYNSFDVRTLATRGQNLHLFTSTWSDGDGNQTEYLHVHEADDDGRIVYEVRFDADDFEGAYRELDRRYHAGEGANFAEPGSTLTEVVAALNRGDFEKVFGELTIPGAPIENRSRMPFPNRSADVLRTSFVELEAMVASTRTWFSAMHWVSNAWSIVRFEREAVGKDGEQYAWTHAVVLEIHDGRIASMCEFEVADEAAAIAYAEERTRQPSRLSLINLASRTWGEVERAGRVRDFDRAVSSYSDTYVFDDRRRFGAVSLSPDIRTALQLIVDQYDQFEARSLAVRGERLHLGWTRWSNEAGYETVYLYVHEVDERGRFVYEARFDADDFEAAYRLLDERYYAGEGAAFAEPGATLTEYMTILSRAEFDRLFSELTAADFVLENRSRTAWGDRSAVDFRATEEDLSAMMTSVRTWASAICWLSPEWCVVRLEREATARDGESYTWTWITAIKVRNGRFAWACLHDPEAEPAAFAYAEEQVRREEES